MEIKTPEDLVRFVESLNLEELSLDKISLIFNRNKWLKKAIDDGKTVIGSNVEGEPFWDEYTVNNTNNKTEEEIEKIMKNWFEKN